MQKEHMHRRLLWLQYEGKLISQDFFMEPFDGGDAWTLLMVAASSGDAEIVQLLLKAGAGQCRCLFILTEQVTCYCS